MEPVSSAFSAVHSAGKHTNVSPAPAHGEATTKSYTLKIHKDIPYSVLVDPNSASRHHERHHLNVAVPMEALTNSPTGRLPVVMHVHGGGWKRGDRYKDFYGAPFMGQAIAEKLGCISIIISYRVGERFPAHAEDVASAIAWAFKNIASYGGDVDCFFLSGHSAGGHLVSLISLDSQYLNNVGVPLSFIKGTTCISGIYTLSHPMDGGFNGWANWAYRKVYIHGTFGDVVRDWELASPITHVLKIAAEILKDAPQPSSTSANTLVESPPAMAPMSPPREQKETIIHNFGDPLASPERNDGPVSPRSIEQEAEREQQEMLQTQTPPVVSVLSSTFDSASQAEHISVGIAGSRDHCTLAEDHVTFLFPTPEVSDLLGTADVPPFLVLNAESDLGLDYDGRVFFKSLGEAGLIAEYATIAGTNHATVTRSYVTIEKMRDFLHRTIEQLNNA